MFHRTRIPLNGLRAVETVARLGSLSRAAVELGTSPGAVSQQVSRTEKMLGITLFARGREGMQPRPEAAEFLDRLGSGFARISHALDALDSARSDTVTVSAAPVFAARWLIWRLPDFYARHPGIKVRIDSDIALVDPDRADLDFAIRVGPGDWPGVKVEPLFDQLVLPVCSPALAERLREPGDLGSVPIIREPKPLYDWSAWLGPEKITPDQLGDGPEFPDASMCLDAAIAGLGVFLAFEIVAHDALRMGSLVAPFPRYRRTGNRYALIRARDRSPGPAQQAFRSWLKGKLAEERLGRHGD